MLGMRDFSTEVRCIGRSRGLRTRLLVLLIGLRLSKSMRRSNLTRAFIFKNNLRKQGADVAGADFRLKKNRSTMRGFPCRAGFRRDYAIDAITQLARFSECARLGDVSQGKTRISRAAVSSGQRADPSWRSSFTGRAYSGARWFGDFGRRRDDFAGRIGS